MNKCAHCEKSSSSLKRCSRCKIVSYCDIECQRAHYIQHKEICGKQFQEPGHIKDDADPAVFNTGINNKRCNHCHFQMKPLMRCSRCKTVKYCSVACQRKDYKEHTVFCQRSVRFQKAYAQIPASLKSKARRQSKSVYTSLSKLPPRQSRDGEYMLMEIVGPHSQMLIPPGESVQVMDITGMTSHIWFRGIKPDAITTNGVIGPGRRQTLAQCLNPGDFILMEDAKWHYYSFTLVGLVVNKLDSVYFIK